VRTGQDVDPLVRAERTDEQEEVTRRQEIGPAEVGGGSEAIGDEGWDDDDPVTLDPRQARARNRPADRQEHVDPVQPPAALGQPQREGGTFHRPVELVRAGQASP
jgi:hypothetical protein